MKYIPPQLCARCKGYKRLCGLPKCPILERFQGQISASMRLKGLILEGSTPPSVLVGEYGYPRLNLYYMVPPGVYGEKAEYYDSPVAWSSRREGLERIIRIRSGLVSARIRAHARDPFSLYEKEVGLATISYKPVDSEALLSKPPVPTLKFDGVTKPLGPTASAEKVRVSGNPKLHRKAEKLIWDDVLAEEGVWELYSSGVDVYLVQRMFSMGFLGFKRRRRLVPTRWSITAVDDIISRRLRSRIRYYDEVGETRVYYDEYLGNKFTIIVTPGSGWFEWIEAWHPRSFWTQRASKPIIVRVEEDPLGRVSSMDGGFSAARLGVLEELESTGRRGDVVILREITSSYYAPLGNWHIRETVRRAMRLGAKMVNPRLEEIVEFMRGRHEIDPMELLGESVILGLKRRRLTLEDYM